MAITAIKAFIILTAAVAAAPSSTIEKKGIADGAGSAPLAKRDEYYGDATYYYQNGNAGSCGDYHGDYDYVCALGPYWQSNNAQCGRTITVTNNGGGQDNNGQGTTIQVLVADECEGCDQNHVDFSVGAFEALTGGSLDPPGEFNIGWYFD